MRDQQKVERSNREEMIEMEDEMREAQPIDDCVSFSLREMNVGEITRDVLRGVAVVVWRSGAIPSPWGSPTSTYTAFLHSRMTNLIHSGIDWRWMVQNKDQVNRVLEVIATTTSKKQSSIQVCPTNFNHPASMCCHSSSIRTPLHRPSK